MLVKLNRGSNPDLSPQGECLSVRRLRLQLSAAATGFIGTRNRPSDDCRHQPKLYYLLLGGPGGNRTHRKKGASLLRPLGTCWPKLVVRAALEAAQSSV